LYATGASIVLMVVAVALANMRMMLMVISGANILRLKTSGWPLWRRVVMMHFLAITSWAQIGYRQGQYPPHLLRSYYTGFTLTIFAFGVAGTAFGYFLDDLVPHEILRLIIYITPLYILLLLMNAQQSVNRLAAIIGGSICPFIYTTFSDWAILVSGLTGGTIALLITELRHKFQSQEDKNDRSI